MQTLNACAECARATPRPATKGAASHRRQRGDSNPRRAEPNGFLVHHLHHSVTLSLPRALNVAYGPGQNTAKPQRRLDCTAHTKRIAHLYVSPASRPCAPVLARAVRCPFAAMQLHQPGIEPGSHRWQGCILPLDHLCFCTCFGMHVCHKCAREIDLPRIAVPVLLAVHQFRLSEVQPRYFESIAGGWGSHDSGSLLRSTQSKKILLSQSAVWSSGMILA